MPNVLDCAPSAGTRWRSNNGSLSVWCSRPDAMRVVSVVSTKGGVGKTTVAANLGGLLADAGLRVLLLDLDSQPTLSSYYALNYEAIAGAYELIALNQTDPAQIISTTEVVGLDLILSND